MGTLLLPSLSTHGETVLIHGVTKSEAADYLERWDERVSNERRIGHNDEEIDSSMEFYSGLNFERLSEAEVIEDLVGFLSTSRIAKKRGLRAVWLDEDAGEIGVGTTVVYNRNWAMNGVADETIVDSLLRAAAEASAVLDEPEVEEEEEEEQQSAASPVVDDAAIDHSDLPPELQELAKALESVGVSFSFHVVR